MHSLSDRSEDGAGGDLPRSPSIEGGDRNRGPGGVSTGDKESQFLLGISRHQHVELNHPQVNGRTMNCGPVEAPCVSLTHADPGPTPGPTST